MNSLIMHVNYCEQGQSLEEICKKAVDLGFDGVEFRGGKIGSEEKIEEYLTSVASAVLKAKLKKVVFGYYGHNLMSPIKHVREEQVENTLEFIQLVSGMFKLDLLNVFSGVLLNNDKSIPAYDYGSHGSAAAVSKHWKWAVDAYKIICNEAEKFAVRVKLQ